MQLCHCMQAASWILTLVAAQDVLAGWCLIPHMRGCTPIALCTEIDLWQSHLWSSSILPDLQHSLVCSPKRELHGNMQLTGSSMPVSWIGAFSSHIQAPSFSSGIQDVAMIGCRYQRAKDRGTIAEGWDSPEQEASVYVDFLRLVLEIINTVIATCLPQNPELVYALLHRQDVLAPLQVSSDSATAQHQAHLTGAGIHALDCSSMGLRALWNAMGMLCSKNEPTGGEHWTWWHCWHDLTCKACAVLLSSASHVHNVAGVTWRQGLRQDRM